MINILKTILFVLLIQSTASFTQDIIKVKKGYFETTYFDKPLRLYFAVPNDWIVEGTSTDNHDFPTGIGLSPKDWAWSIDSDGDTLVHTDYAVQIEVSKGSIKPKPKDTSSSGSEDSSAVDSEDGPDPTSNVQWGETKNWIYTKGEEDVRLHNENGGYFGSRYFCILDNRHGKCVSITSSPDYTEYGYIWQIEKSLRFK